MYQSWKYEEKALAAAYAERDRIKEVQIKSLERALLVLSDLVSSPCVFDVVTAQYIFGALDNVRHDLDRLKKGL